MRSSPDYIAHSNKPRNPRFGPNSAIGRDGALSLPDLYQIVFMTFHVVAKKQFPVSVGLSCHRLLYDFWIRRDKDPGFPVATTSG